MSWLLVRVGGGGEGEKRGHGEGRVNCCPAVCHQGTIQATYRQGPQTLGPQLPHGSGYISIVCEEEDY